MRVSKWGNSLAVRLPDELVKKLNLKSGDDIEIVVAEQNKLKVQKDMTREQIIERVRAMRKPLPKGFKFNREEANAR